MSETLSSFISSVKEYKRAVNEPKQIREILPVERWLSPYYIGPFFYKMYDYWKSRFCHMVNGGFTEILLGGSLGGGKSSIGELLILRKIYELSCYDNMPALFNLPPTSQIVFMYLSVSVQQSERTGFGRLLRLIDSSPYMNENFPRDTELNSALKFKNTNQIAGFSGSDIPHFISSDLFCLMLDEANFLSGADGDSGKFKKATAIYRESANRRKGRFIVKGKEYGLHLIVSSVDTINSFTESRIEAGEKDPLFYYVNTSILDVKKEDFSKEVFYVMPGFDDFDPFVLCEDYKDQAEAFYKASGVPEEDYNFEVPPEYVKESFRQVPIDFLSTFKVDPVNSLKEVLGLSIKKRMRLYYSKFNWNFCINPTKVHPFKQQSLIVSTSTPTNELIDAFLPEVLKLSKEFTYYVHLDQSVTGDCTGISLVHPILSKNSRLEKVVIDFMLQVRRPKDISSEIDIEKVRDFYFYLADLFGIKIGYFSYDMYASRESLQHIKKKGIEAGLVSVDRDDQPYKEVCFLLNKHQIEMYDYPIFREEFFNLIHYLDKRRVDHPEGYSKDVSDSVTGGIWNILQSFESLGEDQAKRDDVSVFMEMNKQTDHMDRLRFKEGSLNEHKEREESIEEALFFNFDMEKLDG